VARIVGAEIAGTRNAGTRYGSLPGLHPPHDARSCRRVRGPARAFQD